MLKRDGGEKENNICSDKATKKRQTHEVKFNDTRQVFNSYVYQDDPFKETICQTPERAQVENNPVRKQVY